MNQSGGILSKLLGWIPNWVGFVLIIIAGVVMIVIGITGRPASAGLIALGVAAFASSILAWYSGALSKPDVNPIGKSFGGTVERIDGWAWGVVFVLFLVAVLIAVFVK